MAEMNREKYNEVLDFLAALALFIFKQMFLLQVEVNHIHYIINFFVHI